MKKAVFTLTKEILDSFPDHTFLRIYISNEFEMTDNEVKNSNEYCIRNIEQNRWVGGWIEKGFDHLVLFEKRGIFNNKNFVYELLVSDSSKSYYTINGFETKKNGGQ